TGSFWLSQPRTHTLKLVCANSGPAILYSPKNRKIIPVNIRATAIVFRPAFRFAPPASLMHASVNAVRTRALHLFVLHQPLQPPQFAPVAPRHRVPRDQPVKEFPEAPRHFVAIAHSQTRSVSALLDFPSLQAPHSVRVLKLPFEDASAFELRHHGRVRHLPPPNLAGQSHFQAVAKLDRASLHFKLQVNLRAIPCAHAVRHEKSSDDFRRSANFLNESQVSHRSPAILPDARSITNCVSPDLFSPKLGVLERRSSMHFAPS